MVRHNIQDLRVSNALLPYVRQFIQNDAKVEAPFDQPFFPTGYVRIPYGYVGRVAISIPDKGVIRQIVKKGPFFSGLISGDNAYMHFFEDLSMVLMELRAGMAHYLFHFDMTHLLNVTTHFADFAPIAKDFNREALAAGSVDEISQAYERFILQCAENRLPPVPAVDDAVNMIEERHGIIRMSELLDRIRFNGSERQFLRLFRKVVGFSPKQFCNTKQINYACQLVETEKSLTEIAHKCGFFDQAHFIRAFRKYIRSSPKQFFDCEESDIVRVFFRHVGSVEAMSKSL